MKSNLLRIVLILLCSAFAAVAADKAPAKLETMIQNALKGYNAADAKAFFADYAAAAAAIATPETYKALYESGVKPQFGKFVSMTFLAAESSINDEAPMLAYAAKFEKGEAKVSVNFMKEDAGLKILQISIQPK